VAVAPTSGRIIRQASARSHGQPPGGGYRRVVTAVAAVLLAIVMGQMVNGISAFFAPLEAGFGWTRADTSLVNAAGLAGLTLGGIVMGFVADSLPVRRVILFGAVVSAGSSLAASQITTLWQFCALFFIAGAFGAGALFGPLFALVGAWFRTGARLAIGLISAGQAIGQGGVPLLDGLMIEALGWRAAFAVIGAGSLVLLVPLTLLVRPAPVTPAATGASGMPPAARPGILPLVAAAVLL
jgi:MFS family permease